MTEIDEETTHLLKMRSIYVRRLRLLEEQQATFGAQTDSSIILQIEQVRSDLDLTETALQSYISHDAIEALGASGRFRAYNQQFKQLGKRFDAATAMLIERLESEIEARRSIDLLYRRWLLILSFALIASYLLLVALLTLRFAGL